jgi:polyisoprenoid-binding protein YceI
MKIVGNTPDVAASDDGQTVTITVTLTHLTTGIELRDKHMREKYLEVQTYPTAVLTVPRVALSFPAAGATQSGDPQGSVALHGQTRPATFHYSATNDAGNYRVDGTVHINMRDFGITVPNYLGVTVKPDVDVDVHFAATDR